MIDMNEEPLQLAGGAALGRMLSAFGVECMFGMGGFQLLPLYRSVQELGLHHYLIEDERTGAFAADAYARITGRPGVCDGTLGPGATNLVTALVEALNAGTPLIAIVGDTHRSHAGKHMTQEARQTEILRPAAKELIRIEDGDRIPELVRRAFVVATAGRPGPVVLSLPEDISHSTYEFAPTDFWIDPSTARMGSRRTRPDAAAVDEARELLEHADRPIILAGGGVHISGASEALQQLAESLDVPVAHTLSGKGSVPCNHRLSVGLFGRYSRFANDLLATADCVFAVGCKLGEIATKRYELPVDGVPLIHLDIDGAEIGRWARTTVALVGDARRGLEDISAARQAHRARPEYTQEIADRRAAWERTAMGQYDSAEQPIHMARLVGSLNRTLPDDAIVVADGGFASHWAGLLFDTKRSGRSFIADRGFASIGYGVGGAIGAQLAAPDRPVVALTGDGGLNMTAGGLETARRVGAGVTLLVVNNAASGYVKALQHAIYGEGWYQSSELSDLDYARLAEGFGCRGIRVEDPADLESALRQGITERTVPTIIDVVVTRDAARMLPGIDSRAPAIRPGDRVA